MIDRNDLSIISIVICKYTDILIKNANISNRQEFEQLQKEVNQLNNLVDKITNSLFNSNVNKDHYRKD